MKKVKAYLLRFFYPLVITLVEFILFIANYTQKTYLVGWDNIMPELNLKLNYIRSLTSVWQDYRGLGTLDGMSHAANLVHTFYINAFDLFLPQELLRYSYIHLTHLAGGIAFYYLFLKLLKNKNGAFIGALFYLFNIGIIQMYFAPLEVFATHFASLPLMGLVIINALKSRTKISLFFVGLASLLTSPQAFVPTIFISYSIFILLLLLFSYRKSLLKRIILIVSILFITNAFWLLPFSYTAISKSQTIQNTRINEFSSEEIYYRNKARGNLQDTLTLKGFMLDSIEYDTFKEENFLFMGEWKNHLQKIPIQAISYSFIVFMIIGSILVVKYRIKSLYPILATNIVSLFFLANNTPLISNANELFRSAVPVLGEAFRFPFTKFITLFAFSYAFLFGLGVSFAIKSIVNFLHKKVKKERFTKAFYLSLIVLFSGLILINAYPVFKGQFTSPFLRLSIPEGYSNAISYFNSQNPNGRVLTFPMESFWNWEYRNWGHRGSGFLWYAIPQAYITRAFDPWSIENENLYSQISSAYSNNDISQFDLLIQKYGITHILIDKTILNTLTPKSIDYGKIEEFINQSTILKKDKDFGIISVYRGPEGSEVNSISNSTLKVYPDIKQNTNDNIIGSAGNYITSKNADITLPFASISTLKLQKDNEFEWIYKNNVLTFRSKLTDIQKGSKILLPSIFDKEFLIPVTVASGQNTVTITPVYPTVVVNGKTIQINIDPIIINTEVAYPQKIVFKDTNTTLNIADSKVNAFILNNFPNTVEVSDEVNVEYFEIDPSAYSKDPHTVSLFENVNSIEVLIPFVDTDLGKSGYVKNKEYVITNGTSDKRLINSSSDSRVNTDGVLLEARNTSTSLDIFLEPQYHSASYAVVSEVERMEGLPVNFYVDDPWAKRSVLETKLQTGSNIVVLPATDNYSKGYGYHFGAKSVGGERALTKIKNIAISPLPQKTIEGIMIVNNELAFIPNVKAEHIPFNKYANFSYKVPKTSNAILSLSQSYDKGWKAYELTNDEPGVGSFLRQIFPFFYGKELTNHLKVNNWANGWQTTDEKEVAIIYLPQYLQFLGFFILLSSLLLTPFVLYRKKASSFFEAKTKIMKRKIEESRKK